MARSAANIKETDIDDLGAQMATLKDDIATLTRTVADMGTSKKDTLTAAAANKAEHLRDKGKFALHSAEAQVRDLGQQASRQVQENPAAAMGIATGVGFVLGLLMARK